MTPKTQKVLDALRANAESDSFENTRINKTVRDVYLDNALATLKPMSRRSFAGHLSALQAEGLYVPHGDDCFGMVAVD